MTEILTESFCERCGTRYTFESSAPRTSRLARVRTLTKGVRNFVMTDEASFSEAMAEARGEEEMAATSHQLDAFHQTFNFCLTCRQYTCGDCWNGPEGRCLTCAPVPGQEEPALVGAAPLASVAFEPVAETNGHEEEVPGIEAWPEIDLPAERLARVMEASPADAGGVEAVDRVDLAEAVEAVEVPAAADVAGPAQPDAGPGLIGVAPGQSLDEAIAAYEAKLASEEREAARSDDAVDLDDAAAQAAPPLPEADPSLAAAAAAGAMAAPEHAPAEPGPPVAAALAAAGLAAIAADADGARAGEPEPLEIDAEVVTPAAEPAPPVSKPEPEPEPVAIEAQPAVREPAPEPVAAEPVATEPEAMTLGPAPAPVAAGAPPAPPRDHVEQPTWPVPPPPPSTADTAPAPAPGPAPAAEPAPAPVQPPAPAPWLTVAPEDAPPPEWPVTPAWPGPASRRDVPTTLAGRPLLPPGGAAALWAASAKEVLGAAPAPFGAAPQPSAASGPAPQAQPCVSCGLSLSANARFCRRCGTRQG